jgi:hypothetical protein
LNTSGATHLVRTNSNFIKLATFGRRHHSLPCRTFHDSPWGLHSNNIFSQAFQVGVPKFELLLFWNHNHLYLYQIKHVWKHTKAIYYNLQKYLSNNVWHVLVRPHLTPASKGFVVKNQISTLLYHNSCFSSLNEQCGLSQFDSQPFFWSQLMHFKFKQTMWKNLNSYLLKPFWWYLGAQIDVRLPFQLKLWIFEIHAQIQLLKWECTFGSH